MQNKYFTHDGTDIAMIGKSGSSAIGKALLFKIKPHYQVVSGSGDKAMEDKIHNAPGIWQGAVPKTETPTNPIIPVRDPVERFRSSCSQMRKSDVVDETLDEIEAGKNLATNYHFRPTSAWLPADAPCRLAKFPEHLAYIATEIGVDEIPKVNDSDSNNPPKPDLTSEQLTRVQAIYADDIALYDSITEAGQSYTAPEPEPTAAEIEAATRKQAFEAAGQIFASMPKGKQALWEQVRQAVGREIKSGNFAEAKEIIETVPDLYSDINDDRAEFLKLF